MAEEGKKTFPMLPVKHLWALRARFKQSIPGTVTDNYLASVLNMQVRSARANILPFLVQLGLIDEEGKTLDRSKQWRDDVHYPEVCQEMVKEVYPQELIDAVPDPSSERASAERWFANHTGGGAAAVRRMVALYTVLCEADPEKETAVTGKDNEPSKAKASTKKVSKKQIEKQPKATANQHSHRTHEQKAPEININLQVHISSDATPDQIDKIFESMAKHIYRKD